MSWHIQGSYFEACHCEAICPAGVSTVRRRTGGPVSRQPICSKARRTAARTSRFGVDRIAVDEIDFFSGLVERQHFPHGDLPNADARPRLLGSRYARR
jgi:hypothetical protein